MTRMPQPSRAVEEMVALARFHRDVTWTGTIEPGGMGPGSPPMTAVGEATHTTIQNGRWITGDYRQDQYLEDGTFVLTWELHWVAGWDSGGGSYVATHADNSGRAGTMRGHIDGDRLTFESDPDVLPRLRLIWALDGPDRISWRNEMSANGSAWRLIEQYDCQVTY